MFSYTSREWYWFDYGIVFLRLLWYMINLFAIMTTSNLGLNQYLVVVLFTFSYLIPQCFHIPNRISSFGFIVTELVLTGSLFVWLSHFTLYVVDLMWIPILSISFLSTKKTQWIGLIGLLFLPFIILIFGDFSLDLLIPYSVAIVLFGTIGLAFRFLVQINENQKRLLQELHSKNEQLVQLSGEIEYLTLKEERNRIAQEIHDAIGHTFTTTIVGLDAITRIIDKHPAAAKEQAIELSHYAREGLEGIRKYVHALPFKEGISIDFALQRVIHSFNKTTGMAVTFDTDEEDEGLPFYHKQHTIILTRSLQESLTNAVKHGRATNISVKLQQNAGGVSLTIIDNGAGDEDLVLGFGLSTMKKRIEEFGGTFQIDSCQSGTTIELKLPINGGMENG